MGSAYDPGQYQGVSGRDSHQFETAFDASAEEDAEPRPRAGLPLHDQTTVNEGSNRAFKSRSSGSSHGLSNGASVSGGISVSAPARARARAAATSAHEVELRAVAAERDKLSDKLKDAERRLVLLTRQVNGERERRLSLVDALRQRESQLAAATREGATAAARSRLGTFAFLTEDELRQEKHAAMAECARLSYGSVPCLLAELGAVEGEVAEARCGMQVWRERAFGERERAEAAVAAARRDLESERRASERALAQEVQERAAAEAAAWEREEESIGALQRANKAAADAWAAVEEERAAVAAAEDKEERQRLEASAMRAMAAVHRRLMASEVRSMEASAAEMAANYASRLGELRAKVAEMSGKAEAAREGMRAARASAASGGHLALLLCVGVRAAWRWKGACAFRTWRAAVWAMAREEIAASSRRETAALLHACQAKLASLRLRQQREEDQVCAEGKKRDDDKTRKLALLEKKLYAEGERRGVVQAAAMAAAAEVAALRKREGDAERMHAAVLAAVLSELRLVDSRVGETKAASAAGTRRVCVWVWMGVGVSVAARACSRAFHVWRCALVAAQHAESARSAATAAVALRCVVSEVRNDDACTHNAVSEHAALRLQIASVKTAAARMRIERENAREHERDVDVHERRAASSREHILTEALRSSNARSNELGQRLGSAEAALRAAVAAAALREEQSTSLQRAREVERLLLHAELCESDAGRDEWVEERACSVVEAAEFAAAEAENSLSELRRHQLVQARGVVLVRTIAVLRSVERRMAVAITRWRGVTVLLALEATAESARLAARCKLNEARARIAELRQRQQSSSCEASGAEAESLRELQRQLQFTQRKLQVEADRRAVLTTELQKGHAATAQASRALHVMEAELTQARAFAYTATARAERAEQAAADAGVLRQRLAQAEAEAAALRAALSDRGHQHVFDLNATATRDAGQLDACRRELRACEEALAATSDTDTKLRAELAEARANERNAKDGIACAERRAEAAVARLEEAETQLRARDVEVARQRAELAAAQARAECAERHAAALSSWLQNVTDPSERSY